MRSLSGLGTGAWVLALTGTISGWGQGAHPDPAQIQSSTEAPSGERVVLTLTGEGVQVYGCQISGGAGQWVFQAPEARLLDGTGATVGSHGAGPTWRLTDGSSVVGEVVAKAAGAGPEDIPSLLLKVKSHEGEGTLTVVDYVRRSDAKGGAAPASGCDPGHAGALVRVPYSARYTFYSGR